MKMKPASEEPYPSKRLGQHFLRDRRTIGRIIEALAPKPEKTIVEIGPGTGALTSALVESASRVIAVEFDSELAPLLSERFAGLANFRLVMADALETDCCVEILAAPVRDSLRTYPTTSQQPSCKGSSRSVHVSRKWF